MKCLVCECSAKCSRDIDVDSDREQIRSLWNVNTENNGKDIRWLDKVTNEEVLEKLNEVMQLWLAKENWWIGHGLGQRDGVLHGIIDGWLRVTPTRGKKRIQMLHVLANDDSYVALKRAAEDTERWRHTQKDCQKPTL